MITRRSLTLLIFVVALCIPASASGKASMQLATKVVNGKYGKRVSATVTFPVPSKSTAAKACKGKVTFSVPIGKKTVKKKKKTLYSVKKSSLKTANGACAATADLKVPETLLGKTLKFTAAFEGNDAVKKFTKSSKFLVVVPAPVLPVLPTLDPTKGPWTILQTNGSGSVQQWSFTINPDGTVTRVDRLTGLPTSCPGAVNGAPVSVTEAPFDTPFKIATPDVVAMDSWAEATQTADSVFKLHFDSPSHATGTFRLTGTLFGPMAMLEANQLYPDCDSGLINVELRPGTAA